MANIFENQTSDYDGSASPAVGVAPIRIAFAVMPANYSSLRIMARPAGTSDPFIPMKFPDDNYAQAESDIFKVDVTGLEYYYQWEKRENIGSTTVTATLTEF